VSALVDTSVLVGSGTVPDGVTEDWMVSAITIGELEAGVLLASDPSTRATRLRRLIAIVGEAPVLDADHAVAARYGELRAASGRLASNDLWIAATALAFDLTLITRDERQAALPLVRAALVG
jgi:predicted nucleic acid-binding protein